VLRNISSPSKLQRAAAEPLAPETIQVLEGAKRAVQGSQLLSTEETGSTENAEIQERDIGSVQVFGAAHNAQAKNQGNCAELISTTTLPVISTFSHAYSRSLRSVSSFENFKSAMSAHESKIELVAEVRDVMHAFRSALKILRNIIRKRIRDDEQEKFLPAQRLETSLARGETIIDNAHR
jgi:hypothetical protein